MTDSVPEKLGKYKIIEEVGRGGFAAVYKAVDTTLDRTVALKFLAPHLLWDPTFVQRFQREAKVAANLDHPNIVTIYEVSQVEGVYFIAMQFLEGRTLSQVLEAEGALPVSQVQAIIEQVASALDYAHARGFVHRDIKPSNIIVASDGKVTLTDFGLVKAGEGTKLSTTGMVFGTPEYMSPEQAEGKVLDAQSDVYSLGVVLFEMLAGQAPFVADTTPAVMYKHVNEPPPLEELPSDLPQGVVAVVEKALAKKREARYQSAGEMARALEEATEARVKVTPIPPEPEVPVPPPVVKKPIPLVKPAAVAEERVKPPTVRPAPKAVPKKALGVGALLAGGLVLLAIVGIIIFAIYWPLPTPTPEPSSPGMVYVPAGEFIMGSDEGDSDEQPVHTLYLDAFYIDKYEVTNTQYWECVEAGACDAPLKTTYYDNADYAQHPVVYVSWDDADTYCRWVDKRLPTEAEWEKACRGTTGWTYPWGEGIDCDHAQYSECGGRTVPVGSKPKGASRYGAWDMAGNVWEWVADWYDSDYYSQSPARNPPGPDSDKGRVLRGGSWYYRRKDARCSSRDWVNPWYRGGNVGFRCARGSQ